MALIYNTAIRRGGRLDSCHSPLAHLKITIAPFVPLVTYNGTGGTEGQVKNMKHNYRKRGRYAKDKRIFKIFFIVSFIGIVSTLSFQALSQLRTTGLEIHVSKAFAMERLTSDWKQQVRWMLEDAGVNVDIAHLLIECESKWNPDAFRVNQGHSIDRGLWQINSYYHSEVSKECAYDPICSTQEAIRIYYDYGWDEWTCGKNL